MIQKIVQLSKKEAQGYVIPLGAINLVTVVTDRGMVGCGAFDVEALDRHGYPAARVRPVACSTISSIEDLLAGEIKDMNQAAARLGVRVGMSGQEALDLM
ncbi:MAG: YunC family protein [Methanosarcinales archaeon]|nr:YunC family protein [Methanosarcinales archaeon]